MIFNFTEKYQFTTRLQLKNQIIEVINSTTVWHVAEENLSDLERVQKSAIKVILQEKYNEYQNGLAK